MEGKISHPHEVSDLDNEGESLLIENNDLDIVYTEKVIELPKHRQEEMGISRIRRRTVSQIPEYFRDLFSQKDSGSNRDYEKIRQCIEYLTEGRFPSFHTWNHTFSGDQRIEEDTTSQFVDEGLYFQEVRWEKDLGAGEIHRGDRYHEFKDGSVFDLSVLENEPWGSAWEQGMPVFAFGAQNKAFVDYVGEITTNPEVMEMLKKSGWNFERDFEVLDKSKSCENKKEILLRNGRGSGGRWLDDILNRNLDMDIIMANNDPTSSYEEKNVKILKMLTQDDVQGNGFTVANWEMAPVGYHPHIPIVKHPSIKPFRWCFAEVAVIPTRKGLNVLFFEKD